MSGGVKREVKKLAMLNFFDGESFHQQKTITITNGVISAIEEGILPNNEVVESLVVPGFIDIQVNGGGGVLLNNRPSLDSLKQMFFAHAKFGTTTMMPTLITDELDVMTQVADVIAQAIRIKMPGVLGIHFEGPHLSVAKKGAHSAEYIREISEKEWQILSRKDLGKIIVTLAPETVSPDDIARMVSLGIKVCLGHSNADFQTAQQGVDAGANGFTHLFNAMSAMQGREPGMTGCALLNDEAYCGLIVDGHHVDYASCRLALKVKPTGKMLLVTDAMPPVGTDLQAFEFFNRKVFLSNGKLTSSTGELAGSVLTMAKAVLNTVEHLGVSHAEALRMASLYPAQFLGFNNKGRLVVGADADFVMLAPSGDVEQTWIAGQRLI